MVGKPCRRWRAFDIEHRDDFVAEVRGVWSTTHWRAISSTDDGMYGTYQVVEFVGDPAYYVRQALKNLDYTKAGCFPNPCGTLDEAKAAVEMLDVMLSMRGEQHE